jgi:hypothetical protein
MGFGHQSVHEKTAGADFDADLMSLCFCARCADRYPAGTRERVRAAVDGPATPDLGDPGSSALETALGPLTDEVRAVRVELSASLRHRLTSTARQLAPDLPITLHADPDPWATGPFAALPEGEQAADVLVGACWGDPATDAARLTRLRELCGPGQQVGAYVLALPPRPADAQALAELLRTYAEAGASEIHLYHAGLASPKRLAAMTDALRLAGR